MSLYSDELEENVSHTIDKRDIEEPILWSYGFRSITIPQTMNESSNIIYINCSTPDVNCTTIVCNLNALKTLQDIGKMVIRFVLDIDQLKGNCCYSFMYANLQLPIVGLIFVF